MKHSKSFRIVTMLIAATLLASCSVVQTMTQRDKAEHALLDAYAGKPVKQASFLAVRPGARAVSDNQIVAWTDFSQAHAYLITVRKGCPDLYLNGPFWVTATGDVVRADSDHVIAQGFVCPIRTIQPVDLLRVQRDLWRQAQAGQNELPNDAAARGG